MSRAGLSWRRLAGLLVAGGLTLAAAGGSAVAGPPPAGAADLNHAAIVIDTGDGEVRRFCLAFPEASISGAEALRRIDVDPVFSSYGAKGEAVCSLCGVGCPAGDCFCNAKYWSYHRAGPGGEPYATSRVGASSTEVRDGDVEGWRWGAGQAPPAATVGQVCDVPEPPARTASAPSSTTTAAPPPATSAPPASSGGSASPPPPSPAPGPAPAPSATAPAKPTSPTGPAPAGDGATDALHGEPVPTGEVPAPAGEVTAEPTTDESDGDGATGDLRAAAPTANTRERAAGGEGFGGPLGVAAFLVVLGGVLGWRARLRRSNVTR